MNDQDVLLKDPHGKSVSKEMPGNSVGDEAETEGHERVAVGENASL